MPPPWVVLIYWKLQGFVTLPLDHTPAEVSIVQPIFLKDSVVWRFRTDTRLKFFVT
jgi:hypothetical protein